MAHNGFLEEDTGPPTKPPDLARAPKSRVKPGSRADITAARCELTAWLDRQHDQQVRAAAVTIACDLGATLIGARVHPTIKASLIEDVARLAALRFA